MTLIESSGFTEFFAVFFLQVRIVSVFDEPLLEDLSLSSREVLLLAAVLGFRLAMLLFFLVDGVVVTIFVLSIKIILIFNFNLIRRQRDDGLSFDPLPLLAGLKKQFVLLILELAWPLDEPASLVHPVDRRINLLAVIVDSIVLTRSGVIATGLLI